MTIHRNWCAALFSTAWLALSGAAANAAPAYVKSTVNLRSGPATTSDIVGKIPGGSRVEANNCSDWCEVTWQGKSGFAIKSALDTSGRVPAAPARRARRATGGVRTMTKTMTKCWSAGRLLFLRRARRRLPVSVLPAVRLLPFPRLRLSLRRLAPALVDFNSDRPLMRRRTSEAAVQPQFAPCETILPLND